MPETKRFKPNAKAGVLKIGVVTSTVKMQQVLECEYHLLIRLAVPR